MSRTLQGILLAFSILLISSNAWSHHPSSGVGLGDAGPVRTVSASTQMQGRWTFTLQGEFIDLDAFSDSELKNFAEDGHDVHSMNSVFHGTLGAGYGVNDRLTISLKIPYIILNDIKEAHADEPDEVHVHGDAMGIGDLTIFGQYRFLEMKGNGVESSLLFGLKTPTGKTDDEDIEGVRFETEFQPGSGSWNPIIGVAASKRYGRVSFDADLLYTIATKGAQETDLGDMFNYDLAASYRLFEGSFAGDLIIEANGEWKQKQETDGVKDGNSGGNAIFLSPGFRLSSKNNLSVYFSAGFPVVEDLNGIQNDTELRAVAGVSIGL